MKISTSKPIILNKYIKPLRINIVSLFNLTSENGQLKLSVQRMLGEHLRIMRECKGLKQQDVADRCGFSRSSYNLIEKGQRNISFFTLYRISKVLDEPIAVLTNIKGLNELK